MFRGSIEQTAGFIDFVVSELPRKASLDAHAVISKAAFVDTIGGRIGLSAPIGHRFDVSAYYRPALLIYSARIDNILEHRLGGEAFARINRDLTTRLALEALATSEVSYVAAFATLIWHTGI